MARSSSNSATMARHRRERRADPARPPAGTATFIYADVTTVELPSAPYDAAVALYSLIHMPLSTQPALLRAIAGWLLVDGLLLLSAGWDAWTGSETDWLGGDTTMWWEPRRHGDLSALARRGWLPGCRRGVRPGGRQRRQPFLGTARALHPDPISRPEEPPVPLRRILYRNPRGLALSNSPQPAVVEKTGSPGHYNALHRRGPQSGYWKSAEALAEEQRLSTGV